MGTQADSYAEGFGHVSQTTGIVFRYLLFAATLIGIVALAILLVYVAIDAFQPFTADTGWHTTYLGTLIVPSLIVGGYLSLTNTDALKLGVTVLAMLFVSVLFAGGVSMIFIDIVFPWVWFSYVLAIWLALGAIIGIERFNRHIPPGGRLLLAVGSVAIALYAVPRAIRDIGVVPVDWLIMVFTLGVPVAIAIGVYTAAIRSRREGAIASGLAFGMIVIVGFASQLVSVDPMPATIVAAVSLAPTGAYAARSAVVRPSDRHGLVLTGVVLGGIGLGSVLVDLLGFAGPESWVNWGFPTSPHSSTAEAAGLYPAIGGSILLMITVAVLAFPLGVGAAVYLEEYAGNNRLTRFIDINISNLAGVPSVVYGLLGLGVFVTYLGQPLGTVLIGGATLSLLILPIVIISAREAIRSVPEDMRLASYGIGATRYQTVRNVVLPRAIPGILTGTILALGRAIGETAPLIMIGAPNVVFNLPTSLSSKVSAMPLQVYAWASYYAGPDFYEKAVPAGVVVLLIVLLSMNSIAIVLRNKYQRHE